MFEKLAPADSSTAAASVLASAAAERAAADRAEARLLVAACEWADLHPPESIHLDRLAELEHGQQQVLLDQVRAWCSASHTRVTIRPVLDLADRLTGSGYSIPPLLREQVVQRDRRRVLGGDRALPAAASSTTSSPSTPTTRTPPPTTSPRSAPSTTGSRPTARGATR